MVELTKYERTNERIMNGIDDNMFAYFDRSKFPAILPYICIFR